ncbi:albumin-2-like [Amaranthus tricolor]|uniref:albumin-2-like n=1 Tax=Amaranthus tricolor TaxID=29722 RepID=UPI00258AA163|nr:albumin-2-like [Amaranthus tricolor]
MVDDEFYRLPVAGDRNLGSDTKFIITEGSSKDFVTQYEAFTYQTNSRAKVNEYSSLKDTIFGDKGIDCAFPSVEEGVAFIFSDNLCAKWSYGLKNPKNKLLVGPSPIEEVFPYLKGTVFANGLDAAFETSRPYEFYLFKGDNYARIFYEGAGKLLNSSPIRQNWVTLRGTIFEKSIDGSFSLDHDTYPNSVYIFKGDTYARVTYTPGTATEKLDNLAKIKSYWTGLGSMLPRSNH